MVSTSVDRDALRSSAQRLLATADSLSDLRAIEMPPTGDVEADAFLTRCYERLMANLPALAEECRSGAAAIRSASAAYDQLETP